MARTIKNPEESIRRQTCVRKRGPAACVQGGGRLGASLRPSRGRATGELLGDGSSHGGAWPHTVFRKQPTAHMGARQGSPQAEAGEGLGVSPPPMHNDTLLPPAALHLALRAALQTQPPNH